MTQKYKQLYNEQYERAQKLLRENLQLQKELGLQKLLVRELALALHNETKKIMIG